MGQQLQGKVAVVSGAARGLGAAWVEAMRDEGATVVGFDIREGADIVADTSEPADVRRVVDTIVSRHGGIDIAIANAGEVRSTNPLDPWEKALADFDLQIGTNLKGAFLLGRAVAPIMVERGGGDIVNISTDHVLPPPGRRTGGGAVMDVYDASKWGLRGLTEAWALALAKHRIRVNELCMGATDAPMLRNFLGDRFKPEMAEGWMRPEALAAVLVELLLEGPDGRTGEQIGFWVDHAVRLPERTKP